MVGGTGALAEFKLHMRPCVQLMRTKWEASTVPPWRVHSEARERFFFCNSAVKPFRNRNPILIRAAQLNVLGFASGVVRSLVTSNAVPGEEIIAELIEHTEQNKYTCT